MTDSLRILYLEDSEPDLAFVQRYVQSLKKHEFIAANNMKDALLRLIKDSPDVFLVDMIIDGEWVDELVQRAIKEKLARYVIPLTARVLPEEVAYYKHLGCNYIISKPFTADDLDNVLNQIA